MSCKFVTFLLLCLPFFSLSQSVVFGVITDLDTEEFVDFATVYVKGTSNATESDTRGNFRLEIEPNEACIVVISRLGYLETEVSVPKLDPGAKRYFKIKLASQESDVEVIIRDSKIEDVGVVREEVTDFVRLPTTSGNFESVLPHIALGASAGNEKKKGRASFEQIHPSYLMKYIH